MKKIKNKQFIIGYLLLVVFVVLGVVLLIREERKRTGTLYENLEVSNESEDEDQEIDGGFSMKAWSRSGSNAILRDNGSFVLSDDGKVLTYYDEDGVLSRAELDALHTQSKYYVVLYVEHYDE